MSNKNKRKKNKKTRKKRGGDGEKGSVCAVCLENTSTHRFCKNNHYFCVECTRTILLQINNKNCPLCRQPYIQPHTDPGMGQWVKEDGYLDISVQFYDGPLIPLYKYGDCCTECEKPGCWGRLCGETENKCNPCIKDELGHIVGVDRNKKYRCKKERYTQGGRRKKKTRKKRGGFLNWFVQRDSDTNNMNLVVSDKPKRKSIYGEPHPLRKYIVDPRDNDDFDEDRTDGFSISFPFFGGRKKKTRKKRGKGAIQSYFAREQPQRDYTWNVEQFNGDYDDFGAAQHILELYMRDDDFRSPEEEADRRSVYQRSIIDDYHNPDRRLWQTLLRWARGQTIRVEQQVQQQRWPPGGPPGPPGGQVAMPAAGGGKQKKKTRKKGGVKVTKSPRKKTAIEIHREKLNNPEFRKRLFANKDTKVKIFEKPARKIHAERVQKMLDDFKRGYEERFGKLNEDDKKILEILKQNIKDKSKITFQDIRYVKEYRARSEENNAKATYIYTKFKEMKRRSDLMNSEARKKREGLRVLDEKESITGTTGEIALLQKEAEEGHGGLEYLPPTEGHPYGVFHKTEWAYEGNLGKTSPVEFVDTGKSEVEMSTDEFNKYSLKRGGRRKKKRKTRRRKNKRKNKTKKNKSTKKMDEDFKPNLTPRQMFTMGSFGGTYWRPIKSKFFNKELKNQHKKYSFLKGIPDNLMTRPFDKYDVKLNKYKKKVGTTLKFWENKGWMRESHPYGWVQWYCDYYSGKRSADDARQIKRWQQLAGPNGRFRKWLVTMILKKGGKWDDHSISPAIRQTLQHWGYKLTEKDFKNEVKSRKK